MDKDIYIIEDVYNNFSKRVGLEDIENEINSWAEDGMALVDIKLYKAIPLEFCLKLEISTVEEDDG